MDELKSKDIKMLMNFLEEFSWISKKYKNLDLGKFNYNLEKSISKNNKYIDNDKELLIGRLPSFLLDRDLFKKNKDLSNFAAFIGIDLKFPEKRSRDEIIGTIICSLQEETNDYRINKICEVIFEITNNENILNDIKFEALIFEEDFDWNRAIKKIYG